MESQERRTYYSTTDEFFFERENDLIQIHFGPNRLQLTNYAAHDLCYRLASYLIFLEHRDSNGGAAPAPSSADAPAETILPDNVLMYPGRAKNEQ